MNNVLLIVLLPVAYIIGMLITSFLMGWAFRNNHNTYSPEEVLAPMATVMWPIGLPIVIVATLLWPLIRSVYRLIYGAYEIGKGQSDLQVGARTKKIFGRIGR